MNKKYNKVWCLFEQSGTFKKEFQKLGFKAYDIDIVKTKNVDKCLNVFEEIKDFEKGEINNLFESINKNDLVFAFFPCTYFSDQSQLFSRGDNYGQKKWSLDKKLENSIEAMESRAEYYNNLCLLVKIAIKKGFDLIIENPIGKCNFLGQYFPVRPAVVIYDRRIYGDDFRKPTQFFFINREPSFNLITANSTRDAKNKIVEKEYGFSRSKISSIFAKRFIDGFIL